MTLHHRQMFSNNDIEANNNNVSFKTNISQGLGPAFTILAGTVSIALLTIFITTLITHWHDIVNILFYAMYAAAGLGGLLALVWTIKTCWIWIAHAQAEAVFSGAQTKRNAVYSVGENHIAYDASAGIEVAQLAQRVTQNYRDQTANNVVDGELTELSPAPAMSELLKNGFILGLARDNRELDAADKKFCWGYTVDGPRVVKFGDVRSLAISGMNGTGKTVTLAFYSSQAVLYGFALAIIDPHLANKEGIANKLKSLQNRMVCSPTDDTNCYQTFCLIQNELANRKSSVTQNFVPWLIVIDELPGIIRKYKGTEQFDLINKTITAVNDEGRKFGMFIIAAGQRWKQTSSGSADVRQSFPAQAQHKNAAPEVALLLGCSPSEAANGVQLKKGQVYMCDSVEYMVHMAIPFTDSPDVEMAGNIAEGAYGISPRSAESSRNGSESTEMESRNGSEMAWEAKVAMFRDLMSQNAPKYRYMAEIWGAKAGDNAKYRNAEEEFQQILEIVTEEDYETVDA